MAVLDPDGLAGVHEDRLIQDEVPPSIDECAAVSLFAVDRPTLLRCTHHNSIGSMPAGDNR
ncbi:hypothetical protein AB0J84_15410 [Micromonospora arborensis]|uniref:hypothetical protein n=1 Tax=Micromonospora arborensis TaxID=2116518 RepID=UPI0034250A6F